MLKPGRSETHVQDRTPRISLLLLLLLEARWTHAKQANQPEPMHAVVRFVDFGVWLEAFAS